MSVLKAAALLVSCALLLGAAGPLRAAEDSGAADVQRQATGLEARRTLEEAEEELAEDFLDDERAPRRGDPWEGLNRPIFAFNETLDRWLLEPVAIGWDFVLPDRVEIGIGNFFDNLSMPIRFANDVLQAKPREAYETLWRTTINTTVGLGGFFDVASAWNVHHSNEDFGQTLGAWGTPPGPYLVLPLFGPSSPRDAGGRVVDAFASVYSWFVPIYVPVAAGAVDLVNTRAAALEDIRAEREAAFDFYTAVRSAYTQYRENLVRDRAEDVLDEAEEEDLYYFDEDDEDVPEEDDDA